MGEIFFSPHSPYDITKVISVPYIVQSIPVNTEPEGAIEIVCIKRVILLKSKIHFFMNTKY